ncbi:hypothetical protein [Balneatrix alpica]|uniref:Guanylate cyclase domain-containing protein n=1 Tax=Balneatrix alpica TaxID=75684 RepID=A0ABV5Z969_9GAMM|nr:hypothetical protein [Balneatrix alpica]
MKGYFLVVDILGFGQMIKNLPEDDLNLKIEKWISIVKSVCDSYDLKNYQLISDTLFIGVGDSDSELIQVVNASRELLNKSVKESIPLRGAISFGDYTWSDELVYGKAVISAHELEMKQDWVGIACIEGIKIPNGCANLICYALPLKKSDNRMGASVIWDVPEYEDLIYYLSTGGLCLPDKALSADWFARVEKTILYSMYIKLAKKYSFPQKEFGGVSPLHSISKHFEETL